MKYKVYTEGSDFVLENTLGYKHRGSLKEVQVKPANNTVGSPRFKIEGLKNWDKDRVITLSEMSTKDGEEMTLELFEDVQDDRILAPTNYVVTESVFSSMSTEQKKGKTFDVIAD